MVDIPYQVYIVSHIVDKAIGRFYDGDTDEFNISATLPMLEFQEWLEKTIGKYGEIFHGPSQETTDGIITESIICVHQLWPGLSNIPRISIRPAKGEIFVGADGIFYATATNLINIQGKVLEDFYGDEHSKNIPDLEKDVDKHLRRTCRIECNKLGVNGTAINEIAQLWIKSVNELQPSMWTWEWMHDQFRLATEDYLEKSSATFAWFVLEQMQPSEHISMLPPISDGELIREVHEAIIVDEERTKQWLILANSQFILHQRKIPEFESIRQIEDDEVFSTTRSVYWLHNGDGIELGEIAGHILHEFHGEIVHDVEDIVRDEIIRLLLYKMEQESSVSADKYAIAVDACHDLVAKSDLLQFWYRDLDPLIEQLQKVLKI